MLYQLYGSSSTPEHNFTSAFTASAIENGRVFYEHAKFVNASNRIGGDQALVDHGSVYAGPLSPGNTITLRIGIRSKTPPYNARVLNYNLTVVGKVGLSKKAFGFAGAPTPVRAQSYFRQLLLGGQPRRPAYNLVNKQPDVAQHQRLKPFCGA